VVPTSGGRLGSLRGRDRALGEERCLPLRLAPADGQLSKLTGVGAPAAVTSGASNANGATGATRLAALPGSPRQPRRSRFRWPELRKPRKWRTARPRRKWRRPRRAFSVSLHSPFVCWSNPVTTGAERAAGRHSTAHFSTAGVNAALARRSDCRHFAEDHPQIQTASIAN
jgi:hypothetical protein